MNRLCQRSFVVLFALASFVRPASAVAQDKEPPAGSRPSDFARETVRAAAKLLPERHLSRHAFDQEIGQRWLKLFLQDLDASKFYFTQPDVNEFTERGKELDDLFRKGEVELAYDIFQRYLKRLAERTAFAEQLLTQEFDFTIDEELVLARDKTDYAADEPQTKERLRKRVKYDLMLQKADGIDDEEARARLKRRYVNFARQMQQTDDEFLAEIIVTTLARAYDPRSNYISPRAWKEFDNAFRQQLDGIGVQVQMQNDEVVVMHVLPEGPAYRDGRLKAGDKISGAGPEQGKIQDVAGWRLKDVIGLIRGPAGTKVRLEVIPAGQSERLLYTIPRDKVPSAVARARILETGKNADGIPYKIGYLLLPSLYSDRNMAAVRTSASDLRKILADPADGFKAQGVDVVLLDMRINEGGLLTEALTVPDLFIDQGPLIQVKDAAGKVTQYQAKEKGTLWDGPLVIMTSRTTGSGAELVVGALQSHGRGLVVGETTNGSGTIQNLYDVANPSGKIAASPRLGVIKITTQQFYRPSGESTQKRGVVPDIELPWLVRRSLGEAGLDYAPDFDRIDAVRMDRADFGIDENLRKKLRSLSAERRKMSTPFQQLLKAIDQEAARQKQGAVTLNLKKFLAERAKLPADSVRFRQADKVTDVERDFYFQEVLAITLDYLTLYKQDKQGSGSR